MNQTTTNTHSVDLEELRLQLEEVGKVYCDNRNPNPEEARTRLLRTLQTNDCQEIITAVEDRDDLAHVFVVAADRTDVDILEVFLNHGMNIDIKNLNGWTALMYASYNEDEECVRFLLDHNAKVDVQDSDGMAALMIASQSGKMKIVEILTKNNNNPDIQDNFGMTALMRASARGYKEIVQLLLRHGADIELKNDKGKTALDLARNEEIKEMLMNYVPSSYVLK